MAIPEIGTLKKMSFSKQLIFAYLTCERLYPNYVFFSRNYDFGNSDVLRNAIDYLYHNLFKSDFNEIDIQNILSNLNKNAPDTEDYSAIYVSSALDACTSIEDSLYFLIDKEFSRIVNISTYATDSVNMYVQEIDNLDFSSDVHFREKIDAHPLMKKEIAIQTGIINFLNGNAACDREDVHFLLSLQENDKKSNLDL